MRKMNAAGETTKTTTGEVRKSLELRSGRQKRFAAVRADRDSAAAAFCIAMLW